VTGSPPAAWVPRLSPDARVRMTLVLRAGLSLSLAILVGALVGYLVKHPGATSGSILATNPILQYLNPAGLAQGLAGGHTEAFLTLGLLVLLATPLLRVATGAYYFSKDGERTIATIALIVLALLLVGLLLIGPYVR
jgi:uncharacterized membrane protein